MEEEVDDVEVEIDRGLDVLLRTKSLHDHVRVEDDEERKKECSYTRHHPQRQVRREEELVGIDANVEMMGWSVMIRIMNILTYKNYTIISIRIINIIRSDGRCGVERQTIHNVSFE